MRENRADGVSLLTAERGGQRGRRSTQKWTQKSCTPPPGESESKIAFNSDMVLLRRRWTALPWRGGDERSDEERRNEACALASAVEDEFGPVPEEVAAFTDPETRRVGGDRAATGEIFLVARPPRSTPPLAHAPPIPPPLSPQARRFAGVPPRRPGDPLSSRAAAMLVDGVDGGLWSGVAGRVCDGGRAPGRGRRPAARPRRPPRRGRGGFGAGG